MLVINDTIAIPESELRWDFACSGGPGGQNVNKVSSKALLRWDPTHSPSLPEPVRARLLAAVGPRLTNGGELLITSQRTRDQGRNVEDCREKLRALVLSAAQPPRPRRPTRPTAGSRQRRLASKTRRSETKRLRRRPAAED
jgi:ribosome-associated protein